MKTSDDYAHWRASLAGETSSNISPSEADIASCGYWNLNGKPIAVWRVDDKFVMDNDDRKTLHDELPTVKGFAFARPVSYEAYIHKIETGDWPGDIAPIGHNRKSEITDYDQFKDNFAEQIKSAKTWLDKIKSITSQAECDVTANHREALNLLAKRATEVFKREREPLDEAVAECRKKWEPMLAAAKDVAAQLRTAAERYLKEETDRRKAEAERQRKELEDTDIVLAVLKPPVVQKPSAGGQFTKKMSLRSVWSAEVVDYQKALTHFSSHPTIIEAVGKLAQAAARSKERTPIPGVKFVEDKRAV